MTYVVSVITEAAFKEELDLVELNSHFLKGIKALFSFLVL